MAPSSSKSRAPETEPETLTRILALAASGDDDDDDFQNPSQVFSISQHLLLSAVGTPNTQPLKPSNGATSRKRLKLTSATGKENRRGPKNSVSNSKNSSAGEEKVVVRAKRKDLAAPIGSGSGEIFPNACGDDIKGGEEKVIRAEMRDLSPSIDSRSVSCSLVSDEFEDRKGNASSGPLVESMGSGLVEVSPSYVPESFVSLGCEEMTGNPLNPSFESGDFDDIYRNEILDEKKSRAKVIENGKVLKERKDSYYAMSIESKLLGSRVKYVSSGVEGGSLAVDNRGDFEPGTQLNMLMNLCSEMGKEGDSSAQVSELADESYGMQENASVVCPLFEGDISNLSKELRHVHTNDCLEEKENGCTLLVVSKSLETRMKASSRVDDNCFEGDHSGDLEQGSHMDVHINMCSKMGKVSSSGRNDEVVSCLRRNGLVECPLCGDDITNLSEEQRQVHANDCLNKDQTEEVAITAGETKPNSPGQVVDVSPVLEWLRSLGFSRYEEAFIREEVDWETLQWLTEEDLHGMGFVALGPRKKIVHALNELRKKNDIAQHTDDDVRSKPTNEKTKLSLQGNKLITEYFQCPVDRRRVRLPNGSLHVAEHSNKVPVKKTVGNRNFVSRRRVGDIPPWCCIPGTPFRVDAFRFLRGDCSHWFLTHFHIDHYQGLTRSFCHGKIYCSSITAHLVNMKIGVPWDKLQILPLNQKVTIEGINLTCLDANHCPGSIMILFEAPNGKTVLHTGDFRFSEEMARNLILQSCQVHTLILDTTYCNSQYDFPKQDAVIQFVIEAIQAEAFNPKTLFLIGSYTIGKERLFLEVARLLKKKVYVGAAKLRLLSCLGLPEEDMQWFTANEMESHIHVVPMWTIASFKRMTHITAQYSGRFNLIVAFSPTGWTYGKGKKKTPGRRWQQGTIIRYEVPYSEHSSFTELREFVRFLSPENIIPSVNNEGPESADAMIALLISDP